MGFLLLCQVVPLFVRSAAFVCRVHKQTGASKVVWRVVVVRGERKGKSILRICVVLSLGGCLLIVQSGCSQPSGYAASAGIDGLIRSRSEQWPYSVQVVERADGTKDYFWEIDSRIEQAGRALLKYHPMYSTHHFAAVEGSIGPKGRKYPVVVDTGASQPVLVRKVHINQNNLRVQTLNTAGPDGGKIGLCYLPELDLGPVKLIDWACLRLTPRSAGLGVRDDFAVVGLPVLREFKYIKFDSVASEVEFSKDNTFEPNDRDLWTQYPIWLEEDFSGNVFLLTRLPVAGQEMELQLDTGSGRGLAISEELWEQLPADAKQVHLKRAKELYPYIGNLSCRRGVLAELALGEKTLHNVPVSVFSDDSPLVEDYGGLLGMQLFKDSVMVLDFENSLMWVKRG